MSRLYSIAVVLDDVHAVDDDDDDDDDDDETEEMEEDPGTGSNRLLPFKWCCFPALTFKNNHSVTMSVVGAINNRNLAKNGQPSPSSLRLLSGVKYTTILLRFK